MRNRVAYAKNRWHLHYKPLAKTALAHFITKGLHR